MLRFLSKLCGGKAASRRRVRPDLETLEDRLAPAALAGADTVIYREADGDVVAVRFSRPVLSRGNVDRVFRFDQGGVSDTIDPRGLGSLSLRVQQLQRLDLTALNAGDDLGLSITAIAGRYFEGGVRPTTRGNSLAAVGRIEARGLRQGSVDIAGDLGKIEAAAVGQLTVQWLGGAGPATQGQGGDLHSTIDGLLGALRVAGDIRSARVSAGRFGEVRVGGSLLGGSGNDI